MQRLEVSGAVRPLLGSLGFKGLICSQPDDYRLLEHDAVCFARQGRSYHSCTLKTHKVSTSETLPPSDQSTRRHIPEDMNHISSSRDSLMSHNHMFA